MAVIYVAYLLLATNFYHIFEVTYDEGYNLIKASLLDRGLLQGVLVVQTTGSLATSVRLPSPSRPTRSGLIESALLLEPKIRIS